MSIASLARNLLAAMLLPATTVSAEPYVAELVGEFFETEQVEVAVSGSVIVGVCSTNACGGSSVQRLQLRHAPSPADGLVCLTMLSRDGIYYSRNTFRLPKDSVGRIVRLPYGATTRGKRLANYLGEDLAIRASAGSCERSTNEYYVLDASATQPPRSIRIFVNSFGATDVFYRVAGNQPQASCVPIDQGRRTSFDFYCDIPWPLGGNERLGVNVDRERYGRAMPEVKLTVFLLPRP